MTENSFSFFFLRLACRLLPSIFSRALPYSTRATSRVFSIPASRSLATEAAPPTKLTPHPLSVYTTCELSDALFKLGIISGGHIPDISLFSPSTSLSSSPAAAQVKICGPAFTVKMVSATDEEAPTPDEYFADAATQGCVMVVQAPPRAFLLLFSPPLPSY